MKTEAPEFQYPPYVYRAELAGSDRHPQGVVDADTIDVMIDVGFGIKVFKRLRFLVLDAWETRGAEREDGLIAKARCIELLEQGKKLYVQTIMDAEGKYGRLLAWVWIEADDGSLTNLNLQLLEEGHGDVYGG